MTETLTKADFLKLNRNQQESLLSELAIDFSKKDNENELYAKYEEYWTKPKMTKTIKEMAQELGLKMENVEFGLKEKPNETETMVKKAYEFMTQKKRE